MPTATAFDRAKAQACAESAMNPKAKSGAGALGLWQFMPGTFGDVAKARHYSAGTSPLQIEPATDAYAYYMAGLHRFWNALAWPERHWFAVGSYNAGPGWIRKAFNACGGIGRWSTAVVCLPRLTGTANAKQTSDYVRRIQDWSP